jgi:hypothetical protein
MQLIVKYVNQSVMKDVPFMNLKTRINVILWKMDFVHFANVDGLVILM